MRKFHHKKFLKKKLNYKLEMNKVERKFMNLKFIKSFKKKSFEYYVYVQYYLEKNFWLFSKNFRKL